MKKETMKNMAGILLFYIILVLGVIVINARMEYIAIEGNVAVLEK